MDCSDQGNGDISDIRYSVHRMTLWLVSDNEVKHRVMPITPEMVGTYSNLENVSQSALGFVPGITHDRTCMPSAWVAPCRWRQVPPYFHRTGSSPRPFGKESRPINHLGVDMSSSLLLQSSTIYLCVELECQEVVHILGVAQLPTSHLCHLCTLTPHSQKVWKTK